MELATEKDTAFARPRVSRASRSPLHIALVGNFPPRRCGISTYTSDLHEALTESHAHPHCDAYAMTDGAARYSYPSAVRSQIRENALSDYADAAAAINRSGADIVCIQHEFGIFGGAAGSHLLTLLAGLRRPVATTLHTVLAHPDDDQRRVMARIAQRSARLIVMAQKGREILEQAYGVPAPKIAVIEHGTPDHPFVDSHVYKERFDLEGRDVLLTFGLLSPNKGIDAMIKALPAIRAARPNVLYVVLGATHPHLAAREGEAYRERLAALARDLDVTDRIRFVNEYVDRAKLVAYLGAADVYVTPYLGEAQITSGTLSYAVGMGKAIVSTPYWHARELLSQDRGLLTPFGDSDALARATISLLDDGELSNRVRIAAYEKGRDMIWARSAERHLALFSSICASTQTRRSAAQTTDPDLPQPSLTGVERMTDNCGILQHSFHGAPDRAHGYCLDDNARALILVNRLRRLALPAPQLDGLATIYAAFVNHAWNSENGKFRNFMSYDRSWLEESGSQDSFGRAFWALGDAATGSTREDLRLWASALADRTMDSASRLTATRARAFATLGLAGLVSRSSNELARSALRAHASYLATLLRDSGEWFEPFVSYDNARLPEALLRAGLALGDAAMVKAGLRTLSWLCEVQTAPSGCFRPVGSDGLGRRPEEMTQFDQQPVEAAATIDACAAALDASADLRWIAEAHRAWSWFLGDNDLATPLASLADGSCYDGLRADGVNRNHGAESVLAAQLSLATMHELARKARDIAEFRGTESEHRRSAELTL